MPEDASAASRAPRHNQSCRQQWKLCLSVKGRTLLIAIVSVFLHSSSAMWLKLT